MLRRLASLFLVATAVTAVGSAATAQPTTCFGRTVTVDLAAGQQPTDGDDVIQGTNNDDVIAAGAGDDVICSWAGDDLIWGQAGNDVVIGGSGDDRIRGGAGDDSVYGDEGSDDISGGTGNDYVLGGPGDDSAVRGGSGDDYVDGGEGNDPLVAGNGGRDVVYGSSGSDVVTGGPRPDLVSGGDGNDEVKGNKGADVLLGGPGTDALRGGPQPDALYGGSGTDDCSGGSSSTDGSVPESDWATDCEATRLVESAAPPLPGNPLDIAAEGRLVIDNWDRDSVLWAYRNVKLVADEVPSGWTGTKAPSCDYGTIPAETYTAALALVNFYREYAGDLRPAALLPKQNLEAQAAALIIHSNGLGYDPHDPPPDRTCWSELGHHGSTLSSLYRHEGLGPTARTDLTIGQPFDGWMIEDEDHNLLVGHRRGIIDPHLRNYGFGTATKGSALHVRGPMDGPISALNGLPPETAEVITWPPEGFVPASIVPARWSLSLPMGFDAWPWVTDWSTAQVRVTVDGATVTHQVAHTDEGPAPIGPTIVIEPDLAWLSAGASDANVNVSITNIGAPAGSPSTVSWPMVVMRGE